MNKLHNSQRFQFGKYTVFAVVFSMFFLSYSFVSADSASKGQGEEYRSGVSRIVQELRRTASQNGGIGQEVSKIAKEQEDSAKKIKEAMDKVDMAGRFRTLFIGTDYKNLGALRSELVKTQNAIDRLTKAMERTTDMDIRVGLQKQIDALKATLAKAETFAKDHESQFSFLGWFVKLFN